MGFLAIDGSLHKQAVKLSRDLYPIFTNMLPEGRLRSYIADRAGISASDDFAMLWVTGTDLPGAATVVDPAGRPVPPPALRASSPDPDGEPLFSIKPCDFSQSARVRRRNWSRRHQRR